MWSRWNMKTKGEKSAVRSNISSARLLICKTWFPTFSFFRYRFDPPREITEKALTIDHSTTITRFYLATDSDRFVISWNICRNRFSCIRHASAIDFNAFVFCTRRLIMSKVKSEIREGRKFCIRNQNSIDHRHRVTSTVSQSHKVNNLYQNSSSIYVPSNPIKSHLI